MKQPAHPQASAFLRMLLGAKIRPMRLTGQDDFVSSLSMKHKRINLATYPSRDTLRTVAFCLSRLMAAYPRRRQSLLAIVPQSLHDNPTCPRKDGNVDFNLSNIMHEPVLALLLLPDPPQRLSGFDDIYVALYPPLNAAIAFLSKIPTPSILDIALPISRLFRACRSHGSLFENVGVLLANVYSLVASIYQQQNLSLSSTTPIDTRVILVIDGDNSVSEPQTKPCGTVLFRTLSRCHRKWTRVFVVESETGLTQYKSFKFWAAEERPSWNPAAIRIPGGLQFYFPNRLFDAEGSSNALCKEPITNDTLIAINSSVFSFTEKYTLTMGLLAVDPAAPQSASHLLAEGTDEERKIYVATVEEETTTPVDMQAEQQKNIVEFLLALLDFGEPKTVAAYVSKMDTTVTSFPLSSIEQKFRIQCLVSMQKHNGVNREAVVDTLVVASKNWKVAEDINRIRSARGWDELKVVRLEGIDVAETV